MNLTFAKTYPKGHKKEFRSTYFKDRIINGQKIHSFRFGFNWEDHALIHFWEGNPRVASHEAKRFNLLEFPGKFSKDFSKEDGHIHRYCPLAIVEDFTVTFNPRAWEDSVDFLTIGKRVIPEAELDAVAINDGLLLDDFRHWMYLGAIDWMKRNGMRHEVKTKVQAPGKVVHWANQRYGASYLQKAQNV